MFFPGVTGHAQEADIECFKKCGANAVLAKPLNFVELNKLVQELLLEQKQKEEEGKGK